MTSLEHGRILVVDDETQITRVLRTSLSTQAYDVRVANDGEMALEIMKDWKPDLAITDLSISGLDPDISPAAAQFQHSQRTEERALREDSVRAIVRDHLQRRQLGVLGEPRVNMLELNLALGDASRNP